MSAPTQPAATRWEELCNDPALRDLPYKIEQDRYGRIVMSPTKSNHSEFQAEISRLLSSMLPHGIAITECAIQTDENVRVADVAWISRERRRAVVRDPIYQEAPEICVEVSSMSNSAAEMNDKRRLYFARGAQECWQCDDTGRLRFFNAAAGEISGSQLCPLFPQQVRVET